MLQMHDDDELHTCPAWLAIHLLVNSRAFVALLASHDGIWAVSVVDQPATAFAGDNLEVVEAEVLSIDLQSKTVKLSNGAAYTYDKLCLCSGARPKVGPACYSSSAEATVAQT